MGKLLSRTAAADMLVCTPQTISNYAKSGLIDEVVRVFNGRRGLFYDEDQLRALAPQLTELSVLQGRVIDARVALEKEKKELEEERALARKQFLRSSGGKRTWNKVRELVLAAYTFAGRLTPVVRDGFQKEVLSRLLDLEDIDRICAVLKASPKKVNEAVSKISRRMIGIKTMQIEMGKKAEMEEMNNKVAAVWEDNRRLQRAYELQSAIADCIVGAPPLSGQEVHAKAKKLEFARSIPLSALKMSTRAESAVQELGIATLYDLAGLDKQDFHSVRGVGLTTIDEFEALLRGFGLEIGMHDGRLPKSLSYNYIRQQGLFEP